MEGENSEAEDQELRGLLGEIYAQYGYDFRGYAQASLLRRLRQATRRVGLGSLEELRRRVLGDGAAFQTLLGLQAQQPPTTYRQIIAKPEPIPAHLI